MILTPFVPLKEPAPIDNVMSTNLNSTLYFTRIALAFMKQKPDDETASTGQEDGRPAKSITLLSSVAGFKESPGLFAYSASKHGVIGLMRGLRLYTPTKFKVRMNVICPWATDTQMIAGVKKAWVGQLMPLNTPAEVARIIAQVAGDSSLNGKSIFVGGGRGFDMEEGINRSEPQWLGEEQARLLNRGQAVLGLVNYYPPRLGDIVLTNAATRREMTG
jgi:NAD(P)-dependent dehydrogenase (short-subunit alcohol dehydrogenase family)